MTRRVVFAVALATLIPASSQAQDDKAGIEFFEKKIRPVLVEHCYKCHAADAKEIKGGLLLDNRQAMRKGGDSGAAVVPGKPRASLLISALKHEDYEMPPDKRLPQSVIADFEKWISLGAPDPRDEKTPAIQRGIDIEAGREFWAFQPIADPAPPHVKDTAWPRTDLDRFVLAALEDKKLEPVADAERTTLVRRLYFDLIGLPPTAKEVNDFLADESPEAVERVVEGLLASPHFGERWGRHWLDVARYAESNGNTRNATFPHAWRYRDYVVDALNADTPYDRFIVQQIAGDLLPADDADQRNANLIATGFLALASKPVIRNKNGGFIPDVADDQIEVTSRAILGLTVACARCHDHKFDPIPTTDYYALAGIFASSRTLYGGGGNTMGAFAAAGLHELVDKDPEKTKAYQAWKKRRDELAQRQKQLTGQLKKLRGAARNRNKNKKADAEDSEPASPKQKKLADLTAEAEQVAAELKKLNANAVDPPDQAMGVSDADKITEVAVRVRGEQAAGQPVPRGFVSVAISGDQPPLPADASGRLELARWMTRRDHPLTARVMVNRIWLHLFDEGLVRTPDNFGKNGDTPSHPGLLDYLATRFSTDDGWSIKQTIRRIVLSRTYALSSAHSAANYEVDPDNVYLWRHARRRLEAEAIRDAILVASGELVREHPGASVVEGVGERLIQDALTPDKIHQPSNHRSLYLAVLRNGLPEVLEVFDLADPSLVVGHRNVTTVPAQDLYLMNSPFVIEQSRHLADRLLADDSMDQAARIDAAFWRALSRPPTDQERERAAILVNDSLSALGDTKDNDATITAWAGLCQALFVTAEFRYID